MMNIFLAVFIMMIIVINLIVSELREGRVLGRSRKKMLKKEEKLDGNSFLWQ